MVVSKCRGETSFIVRGPETRATTVECPADGEWFAIRFKLGTFMPLLPTGERRDHKDVILPDASTRSFWLNGSAWEYPDFENAETFVKRLVHRGLITSDPSVVAPSEISTRTKQRRFLRTTGITRSTAEQIERARHATVLLREGRSILDVAFETGYYDQAHLTRSLKHFIGLTPAEVARADRQLSFLYNTNPR
jgi:AraC-like DNA-binding protein